MKAVILAGGYGTRISEESTLIPKPMIQIGDKPVLWHIMKIYSNYGINDFIICLGYKGYVIKEYFSNYFLHTSDVTLDISSNSIQVLNHRAEPWKVTLIDTGQGTQTGGRLKRIRDHLDDEIFCCTYGDGVGNIDIANLIAFHRQQDTLATLTAVRQPPRFGSLCLTKNRVTRFDEKPVGGEGWINGGFFVLHPKALDTIDGDHTSWEREPLERLASSGELSAYMHEGFWQPMDTLRDKNVLNELYESDSAPWKLW